NGTLDTMITTIDQAGRVVIPKDLREKAGLSPGTEIEIVHDGAAIRIQRAVSAPKLDRIRGRLVARPTAATDQSEEPDIAEIVEAERERWPT
ncbi:MAG: AbrB/MazE/SpoVT family DNA-binding domain-containing protein, partial [Thermoanaerobaculia bacterium]|nr:AbrB/MazE/SpoVT family DNA-binding domain-containing protein [Thermoanaerobaculia bacterium]